MSESILLVDDGLSYAPEAAQRLAGELGPKTTINYAHNTDDALRTLATRTITVAVVDVLFRPATETFERQRRDDQINARNGPYLNSGLAVLQAANNANIPAMIWTDGGDERLLHMRYAYEELGTKVFCLKEDRELAKAVRATLAGEERIPRSLTEEGLHPRANPVASSLFRSPHWAKVWRILALGKAMTHQDLSREAKGWFPYAKKLPGDMATEAANLHAFTLPGPKPLDFCHRFASKNALFLLDATVHERHP